MEPEVEARFERIEADLAMVVAAHREHSEQIGRILDVQAAHSELFAKVGEIQRVQAEHLTQILEVVAELAKAQRVTEQKLQALIDSLRRGGNGHTAV